MNFNKLIDVELFDSNGVSLLTIKCPRKGRKPNITISALMTGDDSLHTFTVTIKNLYIDDMYEFETIKVTAGYEGSLSMAFTGNIQTVYRESPGPESSVVIQCVAGNWFNWTEDIIELNLDENYTISDAINRISTAAGLDTPVISAELTGYSTAAFLHQGTVQEAVHKLRQQFNDVNIICLSNRIYAYKLDKSSGDPPIEITALSSPLQTTAGENGLVYAFLTAPWNPKVKPGCQVSFASGYYKSRLKTKSYDKSTLSVVSVQISFSTCGSDNQMVLKGGVS